ncbi:MAG TPA: glycoside hydrolase family 19 protein [Vicinamibacterales bacterium]|nr:glycoside hydrolase family 19 protein [Vicinamibacterales bacterium]
MEKKVYEVLAGSLNFRAQPGGQILATLPRASRVMEAGPSIVDASNVTWLAVTLPSGSPSGYVSDRYVARVDALGQEGPQATAAPDVTEERLLMLAPTAKAWIITTLAANFSTVATPYGILHSPRRLCHFLAQAAHESAGFRTLEEFGGETYWSRYEGRADLGNTTAGDGVRYHGRGIFQLTGRANYRAMGTKIAKGLEDDPHLAAEGDVSLHTACEYWRARRIEGPADSNDIREVTRRINGGSNGPTERQTYFRRAWSIWGDRNQPPGL